jgi:hypothetical protein
MMSGTLFTVTVWSLISGLWYANDEYCMIEVRSYSWLCISL